MSRSEIETKARFDQIRYAQLWEDADVLTQALGPSTGKTLASICAAGDNALAMLTLDPDRVLVADLSAAQIACLKLRIRAITALSHAEFLELMGSRPSADRLALLTRALRDADAQTQRFWQDRARLVSAYGAGGVGKFESYFRIFRTWLLPLVHSKKTISAIFESRPRAERQEFLDTQFNTWRWRWLMRFFFSKTVMGALGRDKAFFDHAQGSLFDHVQRRIHHAAVACDPAQNPYLYWIMKGTHGDALPLPWRADAYELIRSRLDRLEIHHGSIEGMLNRAGKIDGFNLSDIFEYMSPDVFTQVYGGILAASNPGARLVYWNMMAPRRVPPSLSGKILRREPLEEELKAQDKAFFYSDFVIEEVL